MAPRDGLFSFDAVWNGDGFLGPTAFAREGARLVPVDGDREGTRLAPASGGPARRLGGTLFPALTDHHVHLGLVDASALFDGGITRAVDLGWIPSVAAGWLTANRDAGGRAPQIAIAGGLITCPGGYPAQAPWAPEGAAVEVRTPEEARAAVRDQIALGASIVKTTLDTDAGPTVDDATLRAIVAEAHAAGLDVACHAQGAGQTERAVDAGVDRLAHTPSAEAVPDDVLERAVSAGMTWISTLDINGWGDRTTARHRYAFDNVQRFLRAGGRVVYGTDQGNGDLPASVDERELALLNDAGLIGVALLRSIAGDERAAAIGPAFAWLPDTPPADACLPAWLARARGRRVSDL